jgi:hypothetical protein
MRHVLSLHNQDYDGGVCSPISVEQVQNPKAFMVQEGRLPA